MTWARFDDTMLTHPKWDLSDAAFKLGVLLCVWASKHSRGSGIVPAATMYKLAGGSRRRANRLVAELVNAGKPLHDVGLLEAIDAGWKIHDFQVYAPPKDRPVADTTQTSAARAEAGRRSADARRTKYGTSRPIGVSSAEQSHEQTRTNAPNKTPNKPEQNFAPVPVPEEEIRSAAAAQDLTGSARDKPDSAAAAAPAAPEKVSCPTDLALSDERRKQLATDGVPDYAIRAGTTRFVGKARSDLSDRRTLSAWYKSLFAAVHGMWLDPKQRPNPPESFEKHGPVKAKSDAEVHMYTMPDGRQVRA